MKFVLNMQEYFHSDSAFHNVKTINRDHLHTETENLSCFKKSSYSCILILYSVPSILKSLEHKSHNLEYYGRSTHIQSPFSVLKNS